MLSLCTMYDVQQTIAVKNKFEVHVHIKNPEHPLIFPI